MKTEDILKMQEMTWASGKRTFLGWNWAIGADDRAARISVKESVVEVWVDYISEEGKRHRMKCPVHGDWKNYDNEEGRKKLTECLRLVVEGGRNDY